MESLNQTLGHIHTSDNSHHNRLACQACQRKKIKCDRTFPCGQCTRSNLRCIQSTRKPRARQAGKRTADSDLQNRITRLESLVESLSADGALPDESVANEEPEVPIEQEDGSISGNVLPAVVGRYIGMPFWAALTSEVQSLRDALEEDSDEEPILPASIPESGNADLLICPPASVYVIPGALPAPSPQMAIQLYDIFIHNADPVFKILHRPTLRRFLNEDNPYLGLPANSAPNRALKAAMWFVAVITICDADCFAFFGTSRSELLQLYRRHVDVALAQADLINTADLATVQAFVLYTAALRISDPSRRAWTMVGMIVRIAFGIGLHHELPNDTPYLKEIKRRTWHQIRVLDAFAAVDRGSEVLVQNDSFDTPLPSNANDDDFDESSASIPHREHGLSDVTFNLMCHSACGPMMTLMTAETSGRKGETWQQRLEMAQDFGKLLREKYLQFCDLSVPFHRFIYAAGNSMAASSILRAVRPLHRHVSSTPPRVDSPFVLQLAVNNLRASEATHQDPESAAWRWLFWVQWHALAVALAGLCSIRDTDLANTAWGLVEKAYERHSNQIADTRDGMLWRPIEKLYKTATAFRDSTSDSKGSKSSPPNKDKLNMTMGSGLPIAGLSPSYPMADLPLGAMPTSGVLNQPMDLSYGVPGGAMTWTDWQRIMEDISGFNDGEAIDYVNMADVGVGEMPPPMNTQSDWPGSLQQSPM